MEKIYRAIAATGRRLGADRVVLFGSRARGDNRPRSDIDIAVFGLAPEREALFLDAVDAMPTLLEFDVAFIRPDSNAVFLQNIEKDGVILMDKFTEKFDKMKAAIARLEDALSEYDRSPTDVVRDGVIQRFEFCTELAWKSAREYLIDQGYTEINSPKSVMRKAYADGLIADEGAWVDLLDDRNLTSHIYDDTVAAAVFSHIREIYLNLFRDLCRKLGDGKS